MMMLSQVHVACDRQSAIADLTSGHAASVFTLTTMPMCLVSRSTVVTQKRAVQNCRTNATFRLADLFVQKQQAE